VALRLALDHPEAVSRLVVMDAVPIAEALARCDATFARAWYHWFSSPNRTSRSERSPPIPTPGRRPHRPLPDAVPVVDS
jgi:haloacetate dehalogenase